MARRGFHDPLSRVPKFFHNSVTDLRDVVCRVTTVTDVSSVSGSDNESVYLAAHGVLVDCKVRVLDLVLDGGPESFHKLGFPTLVQATYTQTPMETHVAASYCNLSGNESNLEGGEEQEGRR